MNKKSFALLALMSASAVNIHAANVAELKGNVPEEKATASVAPEEQTANDEKSDDKGIGKINYEPIDLDTDNGVVSLAGSKGFTIQTKKGDFIFKPYMLVQTSANFNWYDDEGLDKAYNQDNVSNSGFAIPNAILGFTGKAFNKVTFNLSLNAAKTGGYLLQQAWFDVKFNNPVQVRVGKFKTPFSHAYLTTLGETLFPQLPTSLTTSTIMPYVLNAVTPSISTGFDLGVELHGVVNNKFGYEVGLFNGTGAAVNSATKTFSDDWHIPSLLYAGRLTYMPWGTMPSTQGNPQYAPRKENARRAIGLYERGKREREHQRCPHGT